MKSISTAADKVSAWIETQYCASVAATLLARREYFGLLEDAMVPPVRLVTALTAWRNCFWAENRLRPMIGPALSADIAS